MQEEYDHAGIAKKDVPSQFAEFVRRIKLQSKNQYLPKGFVPQSVYWLVDGTKFIGKTSIRHKLTPFLKTVGGHIGYYIRPSERRKGYGKIILKLALRKARTLGIRNAVISCDISNLGSKKIIEANGGRLVDTVDMGKGLPQKLRFRININGKG